MRAGHATRARHGTREGACAPHWKKLVRMFHPDLHEQDPEKRKTYETLDTLRASPDYDVFLFAEKDAAVIDTIAAA